MTKGILFFGLFLFFTFSFLVGREVDGMYTKVGILLVGFTCLVLCGFTELDGLVVMHCKCFPSLPVLFVPCHASF